MTTPTEDARRSWRPDEDLDPAPTLWMALAQDVYDDDRDEGMDMMFGYVARVMVEARRA